MIAIAKIAISRDCARVVLNEPKTVYKGRWEVAPAWFDVKGRDKAYLAEFKLLASLMRFKQVGQNGVLIFENK